MTVAEKKTELETNLSLVQDQLLQKRKELIELCVTAEEMRDSASIAQSVMNPSSGNILPEVCENYRNDQAVLLGYTDYDDMIDSIDDGLEAEDDCSTDGTGSWTTSNITLTFDTDHYTVTSSADEGYMTLPITSATYTAGQPYYVSIDVQNGTESSVVLWLYFYFTSASGNHTLISPEITTSDAWTTYSFVFTPSVVSTGNEVVGLQVKYNLTGNFKIRNFVCREYYPDQLMKFDFRTTSEYQDNHGFTIPTTSSFGYIVYDSSGSKVNGGTISTTPGDDHYYEKLYLVKDTSGNLVESTDGLNLSIPVINSKTTVLDTLLPTATESLTLTSDFGESTIKGDANDIKPIFQDESSTIDIYFSWNSGSNELKIGEIDNQGTITNYGAYTYIDEDNSSIDYNAQTISLVFSKTASNDDTDVELRYTYDGADYTTVYSEDYTSFDTTTDVFSRTLSSAGSQGPVLSSVKIYLNGDQIGMINEDGDVYGTTITSSSYFNSPSFIGVSIRGVDSPYENTVTFEYVAKANTSRTDTIGTLNETSVTYNVTLTSPVCLNNIEVYLGSTKIVETSDFTTSWSTHTPSNSLTATITDAYDTGGATTKAYVTDCTCTQSGTFSITITKGTGNYIYPDSSDVLKVVYDVADQFSNWDTSYDQCPISSVTNGGTINTLTISASTTAPELLNTFVIKNYIDHTIYGYLTVMCEGLEADSTWDYSTDTPDDTTVMNHATFTGYLDWLTPYGDEAYEAMDDDLFKSIDPDVISSAVESNLYEDIEKAPFIPDTNGTYTDIINLYKDNYANVLLKFDGLNDSAYSIMWSVLTEYRYRYLRSPKITLADTTKSDYTVTDRTDLIDYLDTTATDTFNGTVTTLCDDLKTQLGALTGEDPCTSVGDYQIVSVSAANGYWELQYDDGLGGGFVRYQPGGSDCAFNELCASSAYKAVMDQMQLLSNEGFALSDVDLFYNELNHVDFRAQFPVSVDGVVVTQTSSYGDNTSGYGLALNDAAEVFTLDTGAGSRGAVFDAIDALIGDMTSGYAKDIYDAVNYAIAKNITFIKDVVDKYEEIVAFYDLIQSYIDEWKIYDSI